MGKTLERGFDFGHAGTGQGSSVAPGKGQQLDPFPSLRPPLLLVLQYHLSEEIGQIA